jgi:cation:H+ antiporter
MATGGGALALATDPAPSESGGVDADGRLVGVDTARLARDQRWFMAIFIVKVALGLVALLISPWPPSCRRS